MNIVDLKKGNTKIGIEVVLSKIETRPFTKKKGNFLSLEFSDMTGVISGSKWDNIEEDQNLKEGSVVKCLCSVSEINGDLQLNVSSMTKVLNPDLTKYIPSYSSEEIDIAKDILNNEHSLIKEPFSRKIWGILLDPNGDLFNSLSIFPAAKTHHHNKLGGLLIHTASVVENCSILSKKYGIEGTERDLLITAALLHDIGKIKEYSYSKGFIDITDEGKLIGHIIYSIEILHDITKGFADGNYEKLTILKHLILSHHGQYEWGSPKLPCNKIDFILHFADNLDSKMNSIDQIMDSDSNEDSNWTPFKMGQSFFKVNQVLNKL